MGNSNSLSKEKYMNMILILILLLIAFFLYWIGTNLKRATDNTHEIKEMLKKDKALKNNL